MNISIDQRHIHPPLDYLVFFPRQADAGRHADDDDASEQKDEGSEQLYGVTSKISIRAKLP